MTEAPILLVLLPFAASLLCLVNKLFPRRSFAPVLGVLATILSLALLGLALPRVLAGGFFPYHLGGWMEPVGIALRLDGLAWISSVIATTVALSALVYSLGEHAYGQYFYFFFLIMIAGMQGVILTGDLFNMFVFLEILSIATYVLVAYPGKRTSLLASFRYLLISSLGLAFSLLGILILYAETGTLSLRLIAAAFQDGSTLEPSCVLGVISFVVGVAVKAALMPLHTWLPDAHAYAPHPVSAVLSGVMIKVSILAVWRVVTVLGLSRLQDLLLWIGAITAATAVIAALAQTDMKRILAFHSVSQMGYIAAGFGAATAAGYTGSAAHILSHSLFKGLLFLAVGAAIHVTGRRNLKELSGLARKLPLVFVCFAVGALSICGIPPFNGYVSKSLISAALKSRPAVYTLLWLASTGTVASFLKLSAAFLPGGFLPARDHAGRAEPRIGGAPVTGKPPPLMTIPLLVLSILCLATGLAGPFYANSLSMLAAGKELAKLPRFYSPPLLSGPLWAVGPGLALFLLIRTRAGESALGRIRLVRLDLETSLILVVSTVLVFFLLGLPVL